MSAVRKVEVAGEHGYSIEIGSGLLGDGARLAQPLRGRHALIVSDGNVAPLYLQQSLAMLQLPDLLIGVFKSLVFAVLIGLIGCHYGLACGRNAQAVGQATTRAVVSIIVALVVSDALITLICTQLGI